MQKFTCSSLVLKPRHRSNFLVSLRLRIPSRSWSNSWTSFKFGLKGIWHVKIWNECMIQYLTCTLLVLFNTWLVLCFSFSIHLVVWILCSFFKSFAVGVHLYFPIWELYMAMRREVLRETSLVRMIRARPFTETYNTRLSNILFSFPFDIREKVLSFLLRVLLQHLGYPDGKALGYCICKSDTITPDIQYISSRDSTCIPLQHICVCTFLRQQTNVAKSSVFC